MAISKYFRPTQHVYQPTYQPLPFKELAATTGLMQNKYEQNVQNLADTAEFAETLPRASFQEKAAEQKLEEIRERLGELREKTSSGMDTISPEFNLELGRLVKDIKSDPFWKAAAHNTKMEPMYKKAIYDDSKPIQNRWQAIKNLQSAAIASENGEEVLLPEPVVPEYVDYQKRLEEYADNFMSSGYKKDRITGEWISTTSGEGVDPRLVANILGIDITEDGYGLKNGIPTAFYMSDAGEQLRRDAQFRYDNLDPELKEEVSLRDMENAIYIDTASKLIPKYSGYTTEEGIRGSGKESANFSDAFGSFFNTVGKLGDEKKAKEMKNKFKTSFMSKVIEFFIGTSTMDKFKEETQANTNKLREAGVPEEDIYKALSKSMGSIFPDLGLNSTNPVGLAVGSIFSKMSKEATKSIAKTIVVNTPPSLNSLPDDDRNAFYNMLSERPELLKEFNREGNITENLWDSYKDYIVDFYTEKDFSTDITPPSTDKERNEYTKLLFGRGSNTGRLDVKTNDKGEFQGFISKLKLYKISEGKNPVSIDDLDLKANTEYDVIYNGAASADNPYGADVRSVTIDGEEYYVDALNENTPTSKLIDHALHSYKYTHNKEGIPFRAVGDDNRPLTDENGDPIVAISSKESMVHSDGTLEEEFVITTNIGLNFRSTISIVDAWNKLQDSLGK